ncbi:DEAD/DEAH box helicase [Actomonas aquatica]|uniref:DEAD/DEAH box helicase n=1 Tax=Actomonas aquatica TaxID=2866162 RepID=A0ABZ1C756_9BACT|nr:DEAD/DEAH box helicase [Opitutus sp. WL0086]WRQ87475.1 DEAD/DEAH box helicase [Opitutus sp. WL0086]
MPFKQLGLQSNLVEGVLAMGYGDPTPIQLRAIPIVLEGRDLIGSAQTGTGKTAAFALPVLQRLDRHRSRGPRVLVLEPTRELAAQVETSFRDLGRFTDLTATVLHGGVGYGKQRQALRQGTDIVIATTGRLMDFVQEKAIDLSGIEVLILDEVDRMLDMGFIRDVRRIVELCPKSRQTLFFSATVPPEIEEVARFALNNPERVVIGRTRSVNDSVKHAIFPVAYEQKFELLYALLEREDYQSVIIFSRTKHGADRIARKLKSSPHSVAVLHANRSQNQRTAALEGFKNGRYEVMVATDIAARGIDVSGVSHVINYDVPENPEDYVHRIGRTGRAMTVGDAYMLACPDEQGDVHDIERFIGARIPQLTLEGFDYIGGQQPTLDTSRPFKNPRRSKGGGGGGGGGNRQQRPQQNRPQGGRGQQGGGGKSSPSRPKSKSSGPKPAGAPSPSGQPANPRRRSRLRR